MAVAVNDGGDGFKVSETYTTSYAGISGTIAAVDFNTVREVAVNQAGDGYAVNDTFTVGNFTNVSAGITGTAASINVTSTTEVTVTGFEIDNAGNGYKVNDTFSFASDATGKVDSVDFTQIETATINAKGDDYSVGDEVYVRNSAGNPNPTAKVFVADIDATKLQTVAFTDGGAGYFAGDKIHVGDAVFYVHAVDTDNAITHIRAEDHAVNNTDPNAPNYDANWAPTMINTDLSVDTKGTDVNANKNKDGATTTRTGEAGHLVKFTVDGSAGVFDDTGFALGADFSYDDNVVGVLYQAIADDATNVAELYVLDAHYADQNALDAVFDGNDTDDSPSIWTDSLRSDHRGCVYCRTAHRCTRSCHGRRVQHVGYGSGNQHQIDVYRNRRHCWSTHIDLQGR